MPEDIASLTKKNVDLEKRLKFAEAKIKALADNMTSSKDIDNFASVLEKQMSKDKDFTLKTLQRHAELANKAWDARDAERQKNAEQMHKEAQKQVSDVNKKIEKMTKDTTMEARFKVLETRLTVVESLVKSALSR